MIVVGSFIHFKKGCTNFLPVGFWQLRFQKDWFAGSAGAHEVDILSVEEAFANFEL